MDRNRFWVVSWVEMTEDLE